MARVAVRLTELQELKEKRAALGPAPLAHNAQKLKDIHGWVEEPEDGLVPPGGWLNDFVLSKRGWESPTLYGLWAGISIMSGILKRDAWMEWADSKLVPNVYMIFVGPPAVVKKSMTTGMVSDFLLRWPTFLKEMEEVKYECKKRITVIEGMSTIEKVFEDLGNPESFVFNSSDGKKEIINPGSAGLLIVPELTTVISKEVKYASTLLTNLCDWYDCKEFGSTHKTKSSGDQQLKDVFFNFVGATTPAAVKADMPKEAVSGGFLSRTMFLYKEATKRKWPRPQLLAGCPTRDILQTRMLWCMKNADGEFKLTPEADQWYTDWYDRFSLAIEVGDDIFKEVHGRMGVNLLKIAMILRAQEYRHGRDITVAHMELAEKLLEVSLKTTMTFLGQLQTNPLFDLEQLLIAVLRKNRMKSMAELQLIFSKRMDPMTFSNVIRSLYLQKMITLVSHTGNPLGSFDIRPEIQVVFNEATFTARQYTLSDGFAYENVSEMELDDQNLHRSHAITPKEAAELEHLQVQEEARRGSMTNPPSGKG